MQPATDDDDDIDLDEISAFLDKEESSDEQQLSDAVLGIESAFADARQAQFKTLVRQHRDPLLNDLLRHSQVPAQCRGKRERERQRDRETDR